MRRRILVVEDHDDSRAALVVLLQVAGHEVDHAPTGPDGLRRALAFRPDVAILDLDLPGMDGYAIAEALRANTADRPLLIATSGNGEQRHRDRARSSGFDAFLLKPWDIDQLEQIMSGSGSQPRTHVG